MLQLVNDIYRHFVEELYKSAFVMKTPKVPTSLSVRMPRSGAGIPASFISIPRPGIAGPKNLTQSALKSVPSAAGGSLGTKFTPRTKTVPSVGRGSLVR